MKKLVNIALCALCACVIAACGGASSQDRANQLKIYNWSDYIDEDLLGEFEQWYFEQTGETVEIVYQMFDINEVMLAKIEKGAADYDLVCPSDYIIERMINHGLAQPIDRNFGNTPDYTVNMSPFVVENFGKMNTPGKNANDYSVGYMWGTVGFMYNENYIKADELSSWGAILNDKFKQKLFMKDAFRDVYSPLLIYLNSKGELAKHENLDELMYDVSDESISKVEAVLNQAKKNIVGWEVDFGKEMMTQEKAWINWTWSGDAMWAIDEAKEVGVNLNYTIPQEGSNFWFDGWIIPKYAVNVKAASYFINYMCMSANAIRNMDATGYVSTVGTEEVLNNQIEMAAEYGYDEAHDASYFFGPIADSVVLNTIMYPDGEIISRCAMMHDTDENTEQLLKMWSRVKGDNLNPTILVLVLVVVVALIVFAVYRKQKSSRRKSKKRYIVIAIAVLSCSFSASAQTWGLSANTELETDYFWRGMHSSNMGIATDVGFNYTSEDENLYAETYFWTFQNFNRGEDYYSEYQFTLYGEFYGAHAEYNHYFGDVGELGLGYTFDWEIPVSLTLYTILYGDDFTDNESTSTPNFSNYLELAIPYSIGNFDIQTTFGFVPRSSVYYENEGSFAISNMLLELGYTFELNDWLSLPIKAAGGYSPLYESPIYFATAGLSVNL